jgi:hypothetical protein
VASQEELPLTPTQTLGPSFQSPGFHLIPWLLQNSAAKSSDEV